jgi:hypothetical protein
VSLSIVPCTGPGGLPGVGDVIAEFIGLTQFSWGDGSAPVGSPLGPLLYVVNSIDPANNWLFGLALDPASLPAIDTTLSHTYAAPGNYVAFTDSCCRISGIEGVNEHINNPDGEYRVETIVNVGTANEPPISALPPIIRCPIDAQCIFLVPGSDPNGDTLIFRLSNSLEASNSGGFVQPGPPYALHAASINLATGLYTWDTTGATLASNPAHNTFYSTQVTIEDGSSKVAVDFLIQLVEEDAEPPVIAPPAGSPPICETTQVVTRGQTKTFDVVGSDPDASETVTLNAVALPLGATMTPPLPAVDNPVSSSFSWTPAAEQVGLHVLTFSASSSGGGFVLCSVTLDVVEEITVSVDVKPKSCPNPLNTNDQGVLPVAILGTPSFNVNEVDVSTIKLAGVSPLRSGLEDVATPFSPFTGKKDCKSDCTTAGADGLLDLTLKFDAQAIVAALGNVTDGQCVVVQLTGNLKGAAGGTPIKGEDVIVIRKKK